MTTRAKKDDDAATKDAPAKDSKDTDAESKDATVEAPVIQAKAQPRQPEGDGARGGSVSGLPPGSDVTMTGVGGQNAASFGRGEELFAAEAQARGGSPATPVYPTAAPLEERVANAEEAARLTAINASGSPDGISTVYPQVGGTTNMALTTAEVLANLDDGAVDERGRLAGTYYDDIEAERADERRRRIEERSSSPEAHAAAARIRELASSSATPAADRGRRASEQGLVDPRRLTGADQGDANDPRRRARERSAAEVR